MNKVAAWEVLLNTINEQWTQHSVLVKKGAMVAVTPKRVSLKRVMEVYLRRMDSMYWRRWLIIDTGSLGLGCPNRQWSKLDCAITLHHGINPANHPAKAEAHYRKTKKIPHKNEQKEILIIGNSLNF